MSSFTSTVLAVQPGLTPPEPGDPSKPRCDLPDRVTPATKVAVAAVGMAVCGIYWMLAARQWAQYQAPSWDQGIFTQLVRAYSELRSPVAPIKGEGYMLLGDHFHPLLVLLAPIYALHPSGFTLLAVQAVLFGATAAIIAFFAARTLGVWGVLIGAAAGLSYLLTEAAAAQFHEIALGLPFLAMSLGMLVRRRGMAAILWSLPLLGVKEDLGLTVAAIGVVVAIRASGRRERWWGMTTAGGGVGAFLVVTGVVLPALNPDGVWAYAGDSIVSTVLSDPGQAVQNLTTGGGHKFVMVALPIVITAATCLRSPLMIVALPTFAWRLSSDVPFHWSTSWHYGAVLVPIVYLAMVDALPLLAASVSRARARGLTRLAPPLALAISLALLPQFALWALTDPQTWTDTPRAQAARQLQALVKDEERVESDITMLAYLVPRTEVTWYGNDNTIPDVYIVNASRAHETTPPSAAAEARQHHPEVEWEDVFNEAGILAARPVR